MTLGFSHPFQGQGFWPMHFWFTIPGRGPLGVCSKTRISLAVLVTLFFGCKSQPDKIARTLILNSFPKQINLSGGQSDPAKAYKATGQTPRWTGPVAGKLLKPLMTKQQLVGGQVYGQQKGQPSIKWAAFYLDSADRAFGLATGLTRPKPRMAFGQAGASAKGKANARPLYYFYFKKPMFAAWCGRLVLVAQFPEFQAYLRQQMEQYMTKVCAKLPTNSNARRLYHYRLLPKLSQIRNSLSYKETFSETGSGVELPRVYFADYLFGANQGQVRISEAGNGPEAERLFKRIQRRLTEQYTDWSQLTSPGIVTANTIYYQARNPEPDSKKATKSSNGQTETRYVVIHQYRWLLLILEGLPNPDRAKPFLGKIYQNMSRIRSEVKRFKKESNE